MSRDRSSEIELEDGITRFALIDGLAERGLLRRPKSELSEKPTGESGAVNYLEVSTKIQAYNKRLLED